MLEMFLDVRYSVSTSIKNPSFTSYFIKHQYCITNKDQITSMSQFRSWPFKRQSRKIVKHTQAIYRQKPTNCLRVFDYYVGLALKLKVTYPTVVQHFLPLVLFVSFTLDLAIGFIKHKHSSQTMWMNIWISPLTIKKVKP